jgi:hypothetical protein
MPIPQATFMAGCLPTARPKERVPIAGFAFLKRFQHSDRVRVELLDLSADGCQVEMTEGLHTGAQVLIRLPGLDYVPVTVAWVHDGAAGLQFQRMLHPFTVERYAQYFRARAQQAAAHE